MRKHGTSPPGRGSFFPDFLPWREGHTTVTQIPLEFQEPFSSSSPGDPFPQKHERIPISEAIRLHLHLPRSLQARLLKTTPRSCQYWAKGIHRPWPGKIQRALRQAKAEHLLETLPPKTTVPSFTSAQEKELDFLLLFWKLAKLHFFLQTFLPGHLHILRQHMQATLVSPPHPPGDSRPEKSRPSSQG